MTSNEPTPPNQPEDVALREQINKLISEMDVDKFDTIVYMKSAPVIDQIMQLFREHERQAVQNARIEGAKTPIMQYDETTAIAVKELCETRLRMLQPTQPPAAADTTKQGEGE